jgi:UTP--glucose-1-phosphate uridylyltransferase
MVRKAVIPAAGLGTRFLPATKAQPKEMLPIIDKPAIQYVVEEAVDSGIEDILIIIGRGKRAIEDHFDRSPDLEAMLKESKQLDPYHEMRRIADMANIHFIRQREQTGLGVAISYARHHIGDEPFAVLLGDTLIQSVIPVTQQLIDIYEQNKNTVIALEEVSGDRLSQFGVIGGNRIGDNLWDVQTLIEKPKRGKSPSNLAIAGRYILTPEIFKSIEQIQPDSRGEIQLTDALQNLLKREPISGCLIEGKRFDLGEKLDFLKTNIEFALKRPDLSKAFRQYLQQILSETS